MEGAPARLTLDHAVDVRATVVPLRRGAGDPAVRFTSDGAVWRVSRTASGPATVRVLPLAPCLVEVRAWGAGVDEARAGVPALLGQLDDASSFDPPPGVVREAHRRTRAVRLCRTGQVLDVLVAAVIEQRVIGATAFAAWRTLVTRHGGAAPGPAPEGMRVPPPAEVWATLPVWEWHTAGVDPRRARTVAAAARLVSRFERLVAAPPEVAVRHLTSVPGIGPWTAAEVVQRAMGAPDHVSVGDYNLPGQVGWAFVGRDVDDAGMLELLEPYRGHRHRAVRHLLAAGVARRPRRGPRLTIQDHRAY